MSESTTPPKTAVAAAYEFPSLEALKKAHYKLLEVETAAADENEPGAAYLENARDFVLRACATGRILEDDDERGIAQTLLNYWATVLMRAGLAGTLASTSLAELDENAGRDLDESQCPYHGLEAYSEATAHLFFGRKTAIANWTKLLQQKRLLVIFGPSGSGKTSLIRAGLVPAFRVADAHGKAWKIIETPMAGEDPAAALAAVLKAEAEASREMLCIYRFDEAIEQSDESTQDKLIVALEDWLLAPEKERRVIAAARVESALALKPRLRASRVSESSAEVSIPPFEAADLRDAIEKPAEHIGLRFEAGIVETLISEISAEPAALTLLQFTLRKLWARRERNRITWAAYEAVGGGQLVVEKTAEAVYSAEDFTDDDRGVVEKMFLRLVRPSLTRELVPCSVAEAKLAPSPAERSRVTKIVDRFAEAGLLQVQQPAPGERLVEVTHEALLRKWPRLQNWLDSARLGLLQRQRIDAAATAWRESGKHSSALWSGVQLEAALAIREQLSREEREFVEAGERWAGRRRRRRRVVLTAAGLALVFLLLREQEHKVEEHRRTKAVNVALNLERAERLVEGGDPAGAFLFFQDALATDAKPIQKTPRALLSAATWRDFPNVFEEHLDDARRKLHQLRLGATWPQLPRLDQLFHLPELGHSDLSPDAHYIVGTSPTSATLWRFGAEAEPNGGPAQPVELLAVKPPAQIKWAVFHPDPAQPLIAVAVAEAAAVGQPAVRGAVHIFDARTGQSVAAAIPFAKSVPQKAWFAPSAVGEALLVITQPAGGRAAARSFSAADFRNVPALLKKLGTESDPVSRFLWEQVPTSAQPLLRDANAAPADQQAALMAAFNRAISAGKIYDEARFTGVKLSPEALRLKKGEPQGDDLIHLNRLLLEDAYPSELRRIRGEVSVWNFRTGEPLAEPLAHSAPVNWAAFSPDGNLVVTAAGDLETNEAGEAEVWAWQSARHAPLQHDGGPMAYAEFDAEGKRVVTAEGANDGPRGSARVWSVQQRAAEPVLQVAAVTAPLQHRGAVTRARFSPDGMWVATGSRDRTARIWHVETGKAIWSLPHKGDVNDVLFSPDGRFLATAGRDRAARLWEIATGQRRLAPLNHSETVNELAFPPDGCRLFTTSKHLVRSWDVNRREPNAPFLQSRDLVMVKVSDDGQRVFTVSAPTADGCKLEVWETSEGRLVATVEAARTAEILCAALDATGRHLAVASREHDQPPLLRVFRLDAPAPASGEATKPEEIARWQNELAGQEVVLTTFDRDGQRLAFGLHKPGRKESVVALGDLKTRQLSVLPGQEPALFNQLVFSPPGHFLLACCTAPDNAIAQGIVWDVQAVAKKLPASIEHKTAITTADFSPDERWLLTGSTDDDAHLWPIDNGVVGAGAVLKNGKEAHTHTADLTRVLFSPDGSQALTAGKDSTAILWQFDGRTASGRATAVLQHTAYVNDAAFSADGGLVLTSSDEPKLRAWSASTGELIALFNPIASVLQSRFAPDGRSLLAIGQNFANRSAATKGASDMGDDETAVREVRPMTWSFAPLQSSPEQAEQVGQIIAARKVGPKVLEKVETTGLSALWQKQRADYAARFERGKSSGEFHQATAAECEATGQWSAAAWHLTQLLNAESDPKTKAELFVRRANAYAKTDNKAIDLPRCIADWQSAIQLRPNSAAAHAALAEACLAYGAVTKPSDFRQWDLAIEAYRQAARLAPQDSQHRLRLGEALAGERDFSQAKEELEHAAQQGNEWASGRLATVGWLAGKDAGMKLYRSQCHTILDLQNKAAYSLLWPSVLTNAFEKKPDETKEDADVREALVRRARAALDEKPGNFYRRNTYGAALYRAGRYEDAIKEIEQARAAYLAERVSELARYYDHLMRAPIWSPGEGRPQDLLFLSMAHARLAEGNPEQNAARRTEAWDWLRKAMDTPELAHVKNLRGTARSQVRNPVPYETLGLEQLFIEAHDLLLKNPSPQPANP